MVYEYLNEHLGSYEARMPLNDASAEAVPLPLPRPSQHTLSPPDLGDHGIPHTRPVRYAATVRPERGFEMRPVHSNRFGGSGRVRLPARQWSF